MSTAILPSRIVLSKGKQAWVAAEYVHGKPNPRLVELFGTHEIPTPFTVRAEASHVLARIKSLNPQSEVVLA